MSPATSFLKSVCGASKKRFCYVGISLASTVISAFNCFAAEPASEHPFLHPLFSDHVVLQRGQPLPVWGWTTPGAQVTVTLNKKSATATAADDGRWQVKLAPFHAGGPYTLTVIGPETLIVNDVLLGDVWLCSGQSNMEMGLAACNATNEMAHGNFPKIRLLTVPRRLAPQPTDTTDCQWLPCNPTNLAKGVWGGFSATAFFFGRQLHREINVPIGLIHSSWGGTVVEAWTSREGLLTLTNFTPKPPQSIDPNNPNYDTVLFNGMIAPCCHSPSRERFGIRANQMPIAPTNIARSCRP